MIRNLSTDTYQAYMTTPVEDTPTQVDPLAADDPLARRRVAPVNAEAITRRVFIVPFLDTSADTYCSLTGCIDSNHTGHCPDSTGTSYTTSGLIKEYC